MCIVLSKVLPLFIIIPFSIHTIFAQASIVNCINECQRGYQCINGNCVIVSNRPFRSLLSVTKGNAYKNNDKNQAKSCELMIFDAVKSGNVKDVNKCLDKGFNVNAEKSGENLLSFALLSERKEIAEKLLHQKGIDINKATKDELMTPLSIAITKGYIDIVKILLKNKKIEVNKSNKDGNTPLMFAVRKGKQQIIQQLIKINNIEVNKQNAKGETALSIACENGYTHMVEILLNVDKIDINKSDNKGRTALFIAARFGYDIIVYMLLKKKEIKVNKANNIDIQAATPLFVASAFGHKMVVEKLLRDKNIDINKADKFGQTPLFVASAKGYDDIVRMLLNNDKIDINKIDQHNRNSLYIAAEKGHKNIVEMLLKGNIDIYQRNKYGDPILNVHVAKTHKDIFSIISKFSVEKTMKKIPKLQKNELKERISYFEDIITLAKEIELNDINDVVNLYNKLKKEYQRRFGDQSKDKSKEDENTRILEQRLNDKMSNNNDINLRGDTILMMAVEKNNLQFVKRLLKRKDIEFNKLNRRKDTALCIAAEGNYIEIVEELLKNDKIDVNKECGALNETPLHIACKVGNRNIVEALLKHKNTLMGKIDNEGQQPFDIAYEMGYEDIEELLDFYLLKKIAIHLKDTMNIANLPESIKSHTEEELTEWITYLDKELRRAVYIQQELNIDLEEEEKNALEKAQRVLYMLEDALGNKQSTDIQKDKLKRMNLENLNLDGIVLGDIDIHKFDNKKFIWATKDISERNTDKLESILLAKLKDRNDNEPITGETWEEWYDNEILEKRIPVVVTTHFNENDIINSHFLDRMGYVKMILNNDDTEVTCPICRHYGGKYKKYQVKSK